MSATEAQSGDLTSGDLRVRGLKLPPPAPPRFSLELKIFAAAALLIFIAVGGAVAVSAYRSRLVAAAKIAEDLKKAGPGWESFQQNRYDELHRSLAVVLNNAGTISMMSTLVPETGRPDPATVFDTLKREQASSARADFLIATTPQGQGLARTDRPLPYTVDLSAVPTIAGAMQGAQTEGIWLSGGKLYHVVAAPVLEGGSHLKGVIAAAFQINDEVARNLEQLLNTQVVFLADAAKAAEPAKAAARRLDHGADERGRGPRRSGAATTSSRPSCAAARPSGRWRWTSPGRPTSPTSSRSVPRPTRSSAPRSRCAAASGSSRRSARSATRRSWSGSPPSSSRSSCRSSWPSASRAPSAAWCARRRTCASATSTRLGCRSSRRTRSGSSRDRSARCSRSCARRPRSSSTSPR